MGEEIRDGKVFKVTKLPDAWRLSKEGQKQRQNAYMKPCATCKRELISWHLFRQSKGKARCGECRRRERESR
jgi:hypothetical protein